MTLLILGAIIGAIMGLTGAGGGIIGVPLLVIVAGFSVQQAAPVALMAVFCGAALGAFMGWRAGLLRYRAALLIAICGMMVSGLGIWLGHQINTVWLSLLFAALLFVLAIRALLGKAQGNALDESQRTVPCIRHDTTGKFRWTSRCARFLAASGGIAGFLSGLLGVGGGFIVVPALQKYTDLDMASVVTTSLAVTALIAMSVVISSAMAGRLIPGQSLIFVAGAVCGMLVGTHFAKGLGRRQIQTLFAYLLLIVALLLAANNMFH